MQPNIIIITNYKALCFKCKNQQCSLRTFPGTFENWTFIFVHFRGAMPFLFTIFTNPTYGNFILITKIKYKNRLIYTKFIFVPDDFTY